MLHIIAFRHSVTCDPLQSPSMFNKHDAFVLCYLRRSQIWCPWHMSGPCACSANGADRRADRRVGIVKDLTWAEKLGLASHQQSSLLRLTGKKGWRSGYVPVSGSKGEVERQRNWVRSSQKTIWDNYIQEIQAGCKNGKKEWTKETEVYLKSEPIILTTHCRENERVFSW